ncbi:MAG: dioxygenase [Neisseria sp.]|nr:dioxygenase [Neisseria sp.]
MIEIRELIKTENAGTVKEALDFMLYECSLDEAPDVGEVCEWLNILHARGSKFSACSALCRQWLEESEAEQNVAQ